MTDADVILVGAGLAGLAAAVQLHRAGLAVLVCESADDVGGRVRTDMIDGFRLDRGFQVLLPAYPEVGRVLDLAALRLGKFTQGAVAVTSHGRRVLAGPWHGRDAVSGVARFALGHPRDAVALSALSMRDLLAPEAVLRGLPGRATEQDLRRWKVSQRTIDEVLRPFLSGVFLDPPLNTSSRLFHLVWRCFLRGGGALPADGMHAIPRQLAAILPAGSIRTSTEAAEITDSGVRLADGQHLTARAVIVATDGTTAARLLPGVEEPRWHAVTTYYFGTASSPLPAPTLVLDGADELLINTAVLSEVVPGYAPDGQALVAASVPEHRAADAATERRVRERLAALYGTDTRQWEMLAAYPIPHALPVMAPEHRMRRPVRLRPGRYVCGDHRDTSSTQGALVSGRRAATAVMADLRSAP